MKKLLVLLLGMAVATASAGVTKTAIQNKVAKYSNKAKVEQVARKAAPGTVSTPFTGMKTGLRADVPEGYAMVTLTAGDVWQDGSGYQMLLDADATAYGTIIPETGALTTSGDASAETYAEFEYKIPENADGSLATENIVMNNSISILVPAGTYDWCITNPTPGDRMWIASSNGNVGGRADDYEFKSTYTYIFTVSLGGSNDQTDVQIINPNAPGVPEITVTPAATSALVEWAADEKATGYNLRWRPWTDLSGNPHFWTFPAETYTEEADGWWVYDADGDGNNWGFSYTSDAQDDVCLISGSYVTGVGACSPDNYIGTPDVPLKGELRFTVWGRSDTYPEVLQVYAQVGDNMYQLFQDSIITTVAPVTYTVDLTSFEGALGSIVFRNYSTYDQWSVYVDDIYVGDPNDVVEPAEWIEVNGLTDPNYTIEGLTPETKYEVQVMGYNADLEGNWCDIVEFTTLASDPEITNVYMLGGHGGQWDCTQGTQFTFADGVYTATITFPDENNYFGFTTELAENNDDGGWAYIEPFRFGAIADEGTDYWYTGEEDFISLTWDEYHAIRIPAGQYKLTVNLEEMKLIIEDLNPQPQGLRGDVNMDNEVAINDVTALIDYLLNGDATGISLENADCNLVDGVTIADATTLIDFLLNGSWPE
jgi:hypothetical protein